MISLIKDIKNASMTEEKKKSAKYDLFAFYIGRPLSYVLTVPFVYCGASPNTVSVISFIPIVAGIVLAIFARTRMTMFCCWLCFFLWNLLDGVDGNLARFLNKSSRLGGIYDAISGYAATAATFLCWGFAAENTAKYQFVQMLSEYHIYLVLGSLSAIFTLYPRLVIQKTRSEIGGKEGISIRTGSVLRIIIFNLTSVSGIIQVFMLVCVFCTCYTTFTIVYFVINSVIMVTTIRGCLHDAAEKVRSE